MTYPVLVLAFWVALIVAAHREPWWLPVLVGAVAAFMLALIAGNSSADAYGRAQFDLFGLALAPVVGAALGLAVIGIRAAVRRVRRNPLE